MVPLASIPSSSLLKKHCRDEQDEIYRCNTPDALIIENKDGSQITVHDFVTKVHEYLNAHKDEIIEAKNETSGGVIDMGDGWKAKILPQRASHIYSAPRLVSDLINPIPTCSRTSSLANRC